MPFPPFLIAVLVILCAAVIAVPLFKRLGLGALPGYLVAGAVIGPDGLGIISDIDDPRAIAELGIVFLLFTIGLELSMERLRAIPRGVYGLGIAQIVVTTALIAALFSVYGGGNLGLAIIVGGGLALSSTAIVLQVISEHSRLTTKLGEVTIPILLLQDLAVGPLLVLLEVLTSNGGGSSASLWGALGLAAVKAVAAIAFIMIAGRLALRPAFRIIAGTQSTAVFIAATLLVALGTSALTEMAGLSMAFGAFLAGLLLAETEYRHQVAADIEPFRELFLGLFFMTVGMMIDLDLMVSKGGEIIALVALLMTGKTLIIGALGKVVGLPGLRALRLGGLLGQSGEFGFILFGIAMTAGLLDAEIGQTLILVIALSMGATPLFIRLGRFAIDIAERHSGFDSSTLLGARLEAENHVVIVGLGEVGEIVLRLLSAHEIPYVALDLDPQRVKEMRAKGLNVYYGNGSDADVLKGVRAEQSRAIVVATRALGVAEAAAAVRRHAFPDTKLFARSSSEQNAVDLHRLGVTAVISEKTDTGLQLAGEVLDTMERP